MDDTFAAPVDQWTMLDPAYIRLKRLMVLIVWGIEAVILLVTIGLGYRWWAAGLFAVVAIGFIGYRWWRVPRMYRAWGYAERDIDLYMQGRLKLDALISRRIKLEQINEAFDEMRSGGIARSVIMFDQ